jgi:hypothetical protein
MAHSSFIHDVKRITVEPVKRCYRPNGEAYVTSGLVIETEDASFTINLFADDEAKLAIVQPGSDEAEEEAD